MTRLLSRAATAVAGAALLGLPLPPPPPPPTEPPAPAAVPAPSTQPVPAPTTPGQTPSQTQSPSQNQGQNQGAAAPQGSTAYTLTSDVRITMSDGISLDSDEYVPNAGCPCPVILIQTPYRKQGGVAEANPYFPEHGYAEIVVDVRGTGSSEGMWDSFGAKEQHDSVELVRWAQHRPFSNGVLGLAGLSYGAINQFLTVEQPGTEAVKAIFPVVPMADSYRDVTTAGGNTDSGFIPLWLGLVNTLAVIPAQDTATQPRIALNAESQHAYDVTQFAVPNVASSTTGGDKAYDGPYYRLRSPIANVDRVHVPTFVVGGLWDLFQRGEPLLYRGLNLPDSQKKLLIGPWYHDTGSSGQGLPMTDSQGRTIPTLNDLQLAWFDHFLKGKANGIDSFPNVEQWYQGTGRFQPQSTYPAPGTTYHDWFLGPDGTLGEQKPKGQGGAPVPYTLGNGLCSRSTDQWTAGETALIAGNGGTPCDNYNNQNEAAGAAFTTAPFAKPATISGPIDVTLEISSTRSDATLVATLTDVAPDGSSNPLTAGSLIASQRALTTTSCPTYKVEDCSLYIQGRRAIPWHPFTQASQQPLKPGQVYEVEIEVFPTSATLLPGHSLRLVITSSDAPHESSPLPSALDQAGGVTTIYAGGNRPSHIYLGTL